MKNKIYRFSINDKAGLSAGSGYSRYNCSIAPAATASPAVARFPSSGSSNATRPNFRVSDDSVRCAGMGNCVDSALELARHAANDCWPER